MTMFDLSGKTAIVTGGNGGIGLGIARGLAQAGANIVIAARNESKTEAALDDIRELGAKAIGTATDVTDEASVAAMAEAATNEFGGVNILVNNAGIAIRKAPQDYTLEEWEQVVDTNLTGTFLCARQVYPLMKDAGGGKIINIGSMTSIFGSDWVAAYSSSKGGVVQLTKSLALSWAADNIQVNSILPGWIHTDLTNPIRSDNPERYASITARIPHGRWGEPDEMRGCAIFLASAASDYVTGTAIPVDGGYAAF
ncbi:MAG: glucose 1-dehydrogenase [SAR202 cluster bacterium]|jgi:2-deoxy-D-gluconate 3-dehydrogenase|nr:glucose 1-dehydrogenase [SAR202 cluster bacterium]